MKTLMLALCTLFLIPQISLAQDRFSAFSNRAQQDEQRFAALKQGIEERWGRYLESTVPQWVTYSKDMNAETVVEFEQGYVQVSVLQQPEDTSGKEAEARVQEELKKLLAYTLTPTELPLLEEQVEVQGEVLKTEPTPQQWSKILPLVIEEKVELPAPKRKLGRIAAPPVPRVKKVLRLPLTPSHLKKRAKKFLPLVQEFSEEFNLEPALVFAIMQTESFFNPHAKSSVAYGLMQLVPKSGARDAYKKRFGKDKIVSADYLYNPRNNIELGTQYLSILGTRVFVKVNDPLKIQYLSISAYNTGAGNVSRAMNGTTSVSSTLSQIKPMTPEMLYQHLLVHLPYEETRGYLKKVRKRMPLYQEQ